MKRKGFTLIELMVVIGILAVLIGILVKALGGTTDSARAAKCLSNMRSLAAAVQSRGMETSYYPFAGSIEYIDIDTSRGKGNSQLFYNERRGWISWASEGQYPSQSKKGAPSIAMCTDDDRLGLFAVTNGALWRYVNGSKSVYVCPLHAKKNPHVRWSYLMNACFGWNAAENYAYSSRHVGWRYGEDLQFKELGKREYYKPGLDRVLLFSEVPFQGAGEWFPDGNTSSTESDGILQYKGCDEALTVSGENCRGGDEHVGANHKSGRNWYAHVVFADGHVEKIKATADNGTPLQSDNLRDLTTWLCMGKSVTFDGNRYEKID